MCKVLCRTVVLLTVSIMMVLSLPCGSSAKSDDDRLKELQKKLQKLESDKAKLAQRSQEDMEKNKPQGKNLEEIIVRWEKLLDDCRAGVKSMRCADAMYNLGSLYYDQSRDEYIKAREMFEEAMARFEKAGKGTEPVNPIPDYSKSLRIYEDLTRDYPEFSKVAEAYYQMGNIYMLMGDLDRCKAVYTKIIKEFAKNPRASMAHFKLADLAYLDHDNGEALKHLEAVKETEVDITTWEMVHYRKAELYYNTGDFDKAIDLFYTYVERCDAGTYKKREFRDMALEFMAVCFSDMSSGPQEAIAFFKKIGHKPYEAQVMYTIGMKNRTHGQWEDAIKSLQTALTQFPYYKDAPLARQGLIECFVVKKEYERANVERERLVDDYGKSSAWYAKNSSEKAVIEQSRNEVKRAIGSIAIYYHAIAQKKKDKSAYEKALKRYGDFFSEFPEDKWRIFEFKYNVAEIYSALGDCGKAAEYYNFVAMEDIAKYPEYKQEIDTLGMDATEVEKLKKKADKGPVVISQEDAGYNVIVAYDNCRKKAMARNSMSDEQAAMLPETKAILDYAEKFQARFPSSANAAEVLYLAGNIDYNAKSYPEAIRLFSMIQDKYSETKTADKATTMLAKSYMNTEQFDLAMDIYRKLISRLKRGTPEMAETVELAAGALYKKAESVKKTGNTSGAAEAFKAISNEFPTSKVAEKGWFDAGLCYEEAGNTAAAAETFENLTLKFASKSKNVENAYLRAADNYRKLQRLEDAARVYQAAANTITKADFAIPSLSSASECYQQLKRFDMAGKMFEIIFERYSSDPKTPQALYNAGLMFEKGKVYDNAIKVYMTLSQRFPESEYAAEAFFSVGLCYEKMSQFPEMAGVFSDYAQKYSADRFKQVQALVKAGNAYFNMKNFAEAQKNYLMAVSVYEKYRTTSDIDVGDVAEAYFSIGEIFYDAFLKIRLDARNERDMKALTAEKTKALGEPAKYYAKAIEIGVEQWTIRGTYMIGRGFVDMAEAVANQKLFGTVDEQLGSKVKILSALEKYYQKAQEYFYKNIEWAHTQNISGAYIDSSVDRFMEMMYRKGFIMEEVGVTLKNAPVPKSLDPEEKEAYRQLLEEKWLEAQDKALPKYLEAIKAAQELGIAQSQWLDKTKERIREIKPDAEELNANIVAWVPAARPVAPAQGGTDNLVAGSTGRPVRTGTYDAETEREMRRIQNVLSMTIPADDKIRQLSRIEMDANRNIEIEKTRIKELKQQLQR